MEYTNTRLEELNIIGIYCSTTNANGQSMQDIKKLWERFVTEDVYSKTSNRIDDRLFAVYTDFEGNPSDSMYKTIIGYKVSNLDEVPDGLIGKTIAASDYAAIDVSGNFPNSLMQAWMSSCNLDINRKFAADLEIYPPDFNIDNNSDMTIYISKK